MKRRLIAFILGVLALFAGACSSEPETQTLQETKTQEPATKTTAEASEPEPSYQYDLAQYVKMGDPASVSAKFSDPTVCTEEEVEKAVFEVLLSNATYTLKAEGAHLYDKVEFDFSLYYQGVLQKEYSREGFQLVLGSAGNPDLEKLLAEKLLDAYEGVEVEVEYTYPDTVQSGTWRGKTVVAKAKVTKVYGHQLPRLDDAFAQSLKGHNFRTAEELRQSVRQDILREKEKAMIAAVWLEFVKTVEVIQYPEKELEQYRNDYREYYKLLASDFGVSLEEYVSDYLKSDMETFEKEVLSYGQELCRNEMVFTQLVRQLGVVLSPEEYEAGLERYYSDASGNFSSKEEFEAYYGKSQLTEELTWDKALLTIAGMATRLEP